MAPVVVTRGDGPVILGMPHVGTQVPDAIAARLNSEGLVLRDTDWHIDRLYADLLPGATIVAATFHRYVIDANRDPSGASLYPGASTTELVPTTNFDGAPIWRPGAEPTADDIVHARAQFHAPYHAALADEIARVKAKHGIAILYDCHSIRSVIPWLFQGVLPDFNLGTDGGKTCAPAIEQTAFEICRATGRTHVLNGRFRGGWTTRHYGRPHEGIHAIQMELVQSSHLVREEPPFDLDPNKAAALRPVLSLLLQRLTDLAPSLAH
jgi:formiminoglutamase